MLALAFFVSVFSSVTWLIFSVMYVVDQTGGKDFGALGFFDVSGYAAFVILPVFVLWMVFGHISQYLSLRAFNSNLFTLFRQMKKNQDYTDLVARIMLEAEQEIKDGFILNKFDLFVADMNELIADLIQRCSIASAEQIERLWTKVQNGGKWAFGKVIIEVNQNQPNFQMRIFEKSQRDNVIAGTVLEFCARYQSLTALLEKHDKERVFIAIIETGVFGKVYSIFAPVADEIRRSREFSQNSQIFSSSAEDEHEPEAPVARAVPVKPAAENDNSRSFVSRINLFRRREKDLPPRPAVAEEKDPFSIALERSFGSAGNEENSSEPKISAPVFEEEKFHEIEISGGDDQASGSAAESGPRFEISAPAGEEEENSPRFSNTQKTLNDLKKEWAEMRRSGDKEPEEPAAESPAVSASSAGDDYTYPFGGWTDETNYKK